MNFSNSNPDQVQAVAYALELVFNDVADDDEMAESIADAIEQWKCSPQYEKALKENWQAVLSEGDGLVAQKLVLDWARQGRLSPKEALAQLKEWYDEFLPLWNEL